jgi:hypothetical protein
VAADDEFLEAAARQLIAAGRSFLDAAEALIDDPEALRRMMGFVTTAAREATRMATDAGRRVMGDDGVDDVEGTDQGP